jgi:ABC-type sugar transport system ATPase subunit
VTKAFGRTVALAAMSLALHAGEVHGLIGETGASTSSLLRILAGLHRPESGTLTLAGAPCAPRGPEEARAAGLALVPQELRIVPAMSVADNVLLGRWPTRRGAVDRRATEDRAAAALARLGLSLDPRAT